MKFAALTFAFAIGCFTAAAHSQTAPSNGAAPSAHDAAPSGDIWRVMMSPYTVHYHYNEDHRHVYLLGLEKQLADGFEKDKCQINGVSVTFPLLVSAPTARKLQ